MHSTFRPHGIYSAQWTPTDGQGHVDHSNLSAHLAFEKSAGIDGVLALGSTGEFPHFTLDERKQALAAVVAAAAPLPVIANITDIRPRVAIELGRYAKSLGLPAVAIMAPIFFPVSQADMLAYFLHVADGVDLPVMLYNFPDLTGKRIDLATVAAFSEGAPMCAIKQSGREFSYHRELIALGRERDFAVMSGADTRLPEVFALGGDGCIGGLVNIVPEWMVKIFRACRQSPAENCAAEAAAMTELGGIIEKLTFPLNIAAGLEARGFQPGVPKSVVSDESQAIYATITQELRALFLKHGLESGALQRP